MNTLNIPIDIYPTLLSVGLKLLPFFLMRTLSPASYFMKLRTNERGCIWIFGDLECETKTDGKMSLIRAVLSVTNLTALVSNWLRENHEYRLSTHARWRIAELSRLMGQVLHVPVVFLGIRCSVCSHDICPRVVKLDCVVRHLVFKSVFLFSHACIGWDIIFEVQ